jgi:hypothetical protein
MTSQKQSHFPASWSLYSSSKGKILLQSLICTKHPQS